MAFHAGPFSDKYIEGFRPEWYISTIYHCRDAPFWSETLDIFFRQPYSFHMRALAKDIVNDKVTLLTVVSLFAGITDVTDTSDLVTRRAVFTCPLTRRADCV